MVVRYRQPKHFLQFDWGSELFQALVDAQAGVKSLQGLPYAKSWMEPLKEIELKNEVAGTSMIEGATFTAGELDAAFHAESPQESATRSQRQVISAKKAYLWIEQAPSDLPVRQMIEEIHKLVVTGCDDDHCTAGALRKKDENVTFGRPPHRGAGGGAEVRRAFEALVTAAEGYYRDHDPLLQALAMHYHLGAIHPFQDGNGRCARGVEAYFLKRAGYSTHGFIGLSNYYYDERDRYLEILARTQQSDGNLTEYFVFGLKGIALQCARIRSVVLRENKIVLFKNMMYRVYEKNKSRTRKYLNDRQIFLLEFLLDQESQVCERDRMIRHIQPMYRGLKRLVSALVRDLAGLRDLGAVDWDHEKAWVILDWPQVMTDSDFGQKILEKPSQRGLPKFPKF
ncbi:MAG: Fic family protein [SAR324 cluster bacterium]|nr:Fic family protein [SAR324 cluster bacterium]